MTTYGTSENRYSFFMSFFNYSVTEINCNSQAVFDIMKRYINNLHILKLFTRKRETELE